MDTFKYLGITLDNKLTFNQHITDIQKRSQQRLSAIHKPKGLYVAPHLLLLLYQSIIQPILLYCSTCFFNILSVTNQAKLTRITNTAAKIIGLPTPNLTELNNRSITRLANTIAQDITHPLHQYIIPLPSGRRYRTIKFRRACLGKSLIPTAIAALNSRPRWSVCLLLHCRCHRSPLLCLAICCCCCCLSVKCTVVFHRVLLLSLSALWCAMLSSSVMYSQWRRISLLEPINLNLNQKAPKILFLFFFFKGGYLRNEG